MVEIIRLAIFISFLTSTKFQNKKKDPAKQCENQLKTNQQVALLLVCSQLKLIPDKYIYLVQVMSAKTMLSEKINHLLKSNYVCVYYIFVPFLQIYVQQELKTSQGFDLFWDLLTIRTI